MGAGARQCPEAGGRPRPVLSGTSEQSGPPRSPRALYFLLVSLGPQEGQLEAILGLAACRLRKNKISSGNSVHIEPLIFCLFRLIPSLGPRGQIRAAGQALQDSARRLAARRGMQ